MSWDVGRELHNLAGALMFDYSWIAAYVSEEMARKTIEQESLKMPISEADRDTTMKKWPRRLLRSLHCMWFADSWNSYQDVLKETIRNECKNFGRAALVEDLNAANGSLRAMMRAEAKAEIYIAREEIVKDSAGAKKEAEHVSAVRGPTWGVDPAHGPAWKGAAENIRYANDAELKAAQPGSDTMYFAAGYMKHGKAHWDYKTHTQRLYEELQAQETANRKAWAEWHAAVDAKAREAAKLQADKKREAAKDARKAENAPQMFRLMKQMARCAKGNLLISAVDEAEALIAMIEDVG